MELNAVPITNWREHLNKPEGTTGKIPHGFGSQKRDMQAGVHPLGAALVGQNVADTFISPPRAKYLIDDLGATVITGLTENLAYPVGLNDGNIVWGPELQSPAESDFVVGQAMLSPRVGRYSLIVSNLLAHQSSPLFNDWLNQQCKKCARAALGSVVFNGKGGAQPIGILNTAGVSTVTFGGPVTWDEILAIEEAVSDANLDGENPSLAWAMAPRVRRVWKGRQKFTGSSSTLMSENDFVAGDKAFVSTALLVNSIPRVVYGNWRDCVVGIWGDDVFVNVNGVTRARQGELVITTSIYCDVAFLRPASFVVGLDDPSI